MSERFAKFADDLFAAVEGYLARSLAPLLARLGQLEQRTPERGKDGVDGKDASPEAIAEAVQAAIAILPPAKDGVDGKSVEPAEVERLVEQAVAALPKGLDGIDGAPGPKGLDGRDGKDGLDGRDAAVIQPLPFIDTTRSYPSGTWAKHARGLWLARSVTEGMNGWDCIVAGVAALDISSDGLRTFTIKAMLSDGQTDETTVVLPTIVYKGAWAAGDYTPGDIVSWDGSMWHCEQPTSERPGTAAWKLCVKHGRDGKDGVRGPRGERGVEGRAGRDMTQLGFNGHRT
jgi:hypothetical protein